MLTLKKVVFDNGRGVETKAVPGSAVKEITSNDLFVSIVYDSGIHRLIPMHRVYEVEVWGL